MRRNLEIARTVQKKTLAAESAFDQALLQMVTLASTVLEHRDEAGLHFAHPAVTSVVDEVAAMAERRRGFVAMHGHLRQAATKDMNLPTVGAGGSQRCPDFVEFFAGASLEERVTEVALAA